MKEMLVDLLQDEELLKVITIVVIVFFISAVIVVIVSLVKRYLKNRPKQFDTFLSPIVLLTQQKHRAPSAFPTQMLRREEFEYSCRVRTCLEYRY